MASRRTQSRLSKLWQFPLLVVSLGLFGYAGYLFIDPQPGPTIDDKIDVARVLLKQKRAEAANEQLNRLLSTEKLDLDREAKVHLMVAESIEQAMKQRRDTSRTLHARIIDQSRIAISQGVKVTADVLRRMGESYESLERNAEALESYRKAIALDASLALHLQRKVIDLQLDSNDPGPAEFSLEAYLKSHDLSDTERAWAMSQQARLLIARENYPEARSLLNSALLLDPDPLTQGEANYWLGVCALRLGDSTGAGRLLRLARDQLKTQHALDGDAAYVLGTIHQEKREFQLAMSFYQDVLVGHPDAAVATPARLSRGVCRIELKEDEAGLQDLHDLVNQVTTRQSREKYKSIAVTGLRQATATLASRGQYEGALEVLAYEQMLVPEPGPQFFARLGDVLDRRADQIDETIAVASAPEKIRRIKLVRETRTRAGDAFVAYSRGLTLLDDKGYGDALWKGVDLYDRASNTQNVISSLELFVAERPEDPLAPSALLRLGRAYQASGLFDKAIAAYQRNQFRYPQSLAASKSAVPLAQAYIAKGPESCSKAESVLLSVVDNNPLITPAAEEFKMGLWELAQLYYRTNRYEAAVARLEELVQRYPTDERVGQLTFLMADSYRKSASLLEVRAINTATGPGSQPIDLTEATQARRERLVKARTLYDKTMDLYRTAPPKTETDRLYNKLSHFYRADCLYDLGSFEESIKAYDQAAFRYQDDPSALAAYVQIVNAYCALGKIDEAKTANERAKWLLRRMPQEAFADGTFAMPKTYWEQWLKWTSAAGMW